MNSKTKIQSFYTDKTVFITGGTGYIGRCLVEKLLRSCFDVKRIILLVKEKNGTTFQKRIEEYFNDRLFDLVKSIDQDRLKKVCFIHGNIESKDLDLNEEDIVTLTSSVNIVFHCAAIVNFLAPLNQAINVNVKGSIEVIKIAKKMSNIQAFVYVSTAWSHGIMDCTEEKVHPISLAPKFLLNMLEKEKENINKLTTQILGKWPNTYLFTKNISERYISEECENLPISIFRPPVVIPTYSEPMPGWTNNLQATTGLGFGLAAGFIKILKMKPDHTAHCTPIDFVVNCLISIAWDVASSFAGRTDFPLIPTYSEPMPGWTNNLQATTGLGFGLAAGFIKILKMKPDHTAHCTPIDFVVNCLISIAWDVASNYKFGELPVYNYNATENPVTHKFFFDSFVNTKYPLECAIWYPGYITTNASLWLYDKYLLMLNIPVYIIHVVFLLMKKETKFYKMFKLQRKMLVQSSYFLSKDFKFEYKNVPSLWRKMSFGDQDKFNFDMRTIVWHEYMDTYCKTLKFLKKEDLREVRRTQMKQIWLGILHYFTLAALCFIFYKLLFCILC